MGLRIGATARSGPLWRMVEDGHELYRIPGTARDPQFGPTPCTIAAPRQRGDSLRAVNQYTEIRMNNGELVEALAAAWKLPKSQAA